MRGKRKVTVAEGLILLGILVALALPFLGRRERSQQRVESAKSGGASAEPGAVPSDGDVSGEETGDELAPAGAAGSLAARIQVAAFLVMAVVVPTFMVREMLKRRRR